MGFFPTLEAVLRVLQLDETYESTSMASVELVVFLSLLLDLFAFTIPLPLFPRLIEWYTLVSTQAAALALVEYAG